MSNAKSRRLSRGDWLEAAVALLAEGGVEKVRVEVLARRLGVTKGSFYWHFQNRAALLDGVVSMWESLGTELLITTVDASDRSPEDRLRLLWVLATDDDLGAELALREWARRDEALAKRVAAVDRRRLAYVQKHFEDMGHTRQTAAARAMQMYSLLIGAYFVQLDGAEALADCLDDLLARP